MAPPNTPGNWNSIFGGGGGDSTPSASAAAAAAGPSNAMVPYHGPAETPASGSSNNTYIMPSSPMKRAVMDGYRPKVTRTLGQRPACLVNASVTYCGNNQIYAFGGFDQYTDEVYNHVLRLDLIKHEWSLVDNYGDIPGVRMGTYKSCLSLATASRPDGRAHSLLLTVFRSHRNVIPGRQAACLWWRERTPNLSLRPHYIRFEDCPLDATRCVRSDSQRPSPTCSPPTRRQIVHHRRNNWS